MELSNQEKQLWRPGYKVVAGVDEAGRGAWAGPLVVGAVLLTANFYKQLPAWVALVNDSKKLTPRRRQQLFVKIKTTLVWSVGLVASREIDKIGIGEANRLGVIRAVNNLKNKPDYIVSDYVAKLPVTINHVPTRNITHGDAKFIIVALASIVAKVYRDELVTQYDKKYPGYGFAKHKGYGTKQHIKALQELGVCKIHRRSYRPIVQYLV
ncbi:MAG: ribonuclease HII [Candidatus Kerfeldbacteria bacterium]|nr:ribonuclease HII [Candidatus Kerfeldbacteria bacterium]